MCGKTAGRIDKHCLERVGKRLYKRRKERWSAASSMPNSSMDIATRGCASWQRSHSSAYWRPRRTSRRLSCSAERTKISSHRLYAPPGVPVSERSATSPDAQNNPRPAHRRRGLAVLGKLYAMRRFTTPATPSRPVPSRVKLESSGTGATSAIVIGTSSKTVVPLARSSNASSAEPSGL